MSMYYNNRTDEGKLPATCFESSRLLNYFICKIDFILFFNLDLTTFYAHVLLRGNNTAIIQKNCCYVSHM